MNGGLPPPLECRPPGQPALAHLLAPWLCGRERSLLRRLVNRVSRRDIMSLAGGLPAVDLFPRDAFGEKLRELLVQPASEGSE